MMPPNPRRPGLPGVNPEAQRRHAERDWHEILSGITLTPAQAAGISALETDTTSKGDPLWKGDSMEIKMNNAGCRIITTNVAKKLMTIVDTMRPQEDPTAGPQEILYIDMLIDYMQRMQGDIMICHEPGRISGLESTIKKKAQDAYMDVIIECNPKSKAAGAVILLSPAWKKVTTRHWNPLEGITREDRRACLMEFTAKSKHRTRDQDGAWKEHPLDRILVASVQH